MLSSTLAASRIRHFLVALFKTAADTLADGCMGHTKTDRIAKFRAFMSKNQTMNCTGEERRSFYDKVIGLAQSMRLILFILTNLTANF